MCKSNEWLRAAARVTCVIVLAGACGPACSKDSAPSGPHDAALGVIEGAPSVGNFDDLGAPDASMGSPDGAAPELDSSTPSVDSGSPSVNAEDSPLDDGAAISGVVLTNAPHLAFVDEGMSGITIVTASFRVLPYGDGTFFMLMYGDAENRSAQRVCIPSSDRFIIDDGVDELVVFEGEPFVSTSGGVTSDCLETGARAIWTGIVSEVPEDHISGAHQVRYAFSGIPVASTFMRSALEPTVLVADPVVPTTDAGVDVGYTIAGTLRSGAMPIYNVTISLYARARNGLIVDDTNAYPNNQVTLAASTTYFFESFPFSFYAERPDSLTYYVSFIEGTDPTPNLRVVYDPPADTELGRRISAVARDRRAYDEARARLPSR